MLQAKPHSCANETDLARYISAQLISIAENARKKISQKKILQQITEFREQLMNKRQLLMEQERELIKII